MEQLVAVVLVLAAAWGYMMAARPDQDLPEVAATLGQAWALAAKPDRERTVEARAWAWAARSQDEVA
jgi:hypothetical protein